MELKTSDWEDLLKTVEREQKQLALSAKINKAVYDMICKELKQQDK